MRKLPLLSPLGILSASLLSCCMAAPTWANPVTLYYGNYGANNYGSYPSYGTWIYGSPIPAPMPVNPVTGSAVNPQFSNVYVIGQPVRRRSHRAIDNSILVRPIVINSQIFNSVLIDPKIIDRAPDYPNYLNGYTDGYLRY